MQHEGHAAEINTVAFAPSSSYLLLTGSSDHVSQYQDYLVDFRLLRFGISENSLSNFIRSSLTPMTFFKSLGRHTLPSTLPLLAPTVEFTSGISLPSARNKPRMTLKTAHLNSFSFTADTQPESAIYLGVPWPNGTWRPLRTTTFCKSGSRRGTFELQPILMLGRWSWNNIIGT